jgi:hypothetical protein
MIKASKESQEIKQAKTIIGFFITDVIISIVYTIIFKTSMNRIYTSITFAQMLVLLLLFETNLPNGIIIILRELSSFLLSFEFMVPSTLKYPYPGCSLYDRKLNLCSTMKLLRFESRAAINNLIFPLIIFFIMGFIHSVVALIYYRFRKTKFDVIFCV